MADVPNLVSESTSPYPGSVNGTGPRVEGTPTQQAVGATEKTPTSVIEGRDQNLNIYAPAKEHSPIPARTKNYIASVVNRYVLYAQDMRDNPDTTSEYQNDPFLKMVVEMSGRHGDFSKWTEPTALTERKWMEGDAEPYNLFDPNVPEKDDKKKKGKDKKEGEKKSETPKPGTKEFPLSSFSDNDLRIIDTILRLEELELAAAEGVEITNDRIPVRIRETFDERDEIHEDVKQFALTPVEQRKSIGERLRDRFRRSPQTAPQTPDQFILEDEAGNEVPSLTTSERIISQLGRKTRVTPTRYSEHYKYARERLGSAGRIRELAEVHNASIALRQSIYGERAWNQLTQVNPEFQADRMTNTVGHATDRIRAEQFDGRPDSRLSPAERISLRRQALKAALYEATGTKKEIAQAQTEQDREFHQDLIKNAQTKAKEKRDNAATRVVYKQETTDTDGLTEKREIPQAEYQRLEAEKAELERRKKGYTDQLTKLNTEQILLMQSIRGIEGAVKVPDEQRAEIDPLTEANFILDQKERSIQKEIDKVRAKMRASIIDLTNDADRDRRIDAYVTRYRARYIERKSGNITEETPQDVRTRVIENEKAWEKNAESISNLQTEIQDLQSMRNRLAFVSREKSTLESGEQNLTRQIGEIKIERIEERPAEQADQIEFIIGTGENPRVHTERQRHIVETMFEKKSRERAFESMDSYRNTLFNVETDLDKQDMAEQVLSREVMINALARSFGMTKTDWQRLIGLDRTDFDYLTDNGTIDWNAISLGTGRVAGSTSRRPVPGGGVTPAMDIGEFKDHIEKYFLNRLRKSSPANANLVSQRIINERLYAASKGTPAEFTGYGMPNAERDRIEELEAQERERQQQQAQQSQTPDQFQIGQP
ncbi:hypothetical protein HY469_01780 [Candidatus Roizmanbacteria bacterium]|nr:hypothetical protein [Candidatus Roizmanbacteria bacterium]